ncbi:MAG: N-formylglutamate deformylase [Planctomycetota bacterium]
MIDVNVGDSPLLVSVPHAGTQVPEPMLGGFSPAARALPDTDWFVDRLYDWAPRLGCTMLVTRMSRYVIDVNRPPDDTPLYDTATTGLVPLCQFDGTPIYAEPPTSTEVLDRRSRYYDPYHDALRSQLDRIHANHGHAVLFDAHSIRSEVPRLFEGKLPELNLGTYSQQSAATSLIQLVTGEIADSDYSHVVDGRFKGGYITRHYGRPEAGIHALQLELSQVTYMDEAHGHYDDRGATKLQSLLRPILQSLMEWRP